MNELMFRSVHQFVQRNKSKPFLCQRTTLALYPASFFFFFFKKTYTGHWWFRRHTCSHTLCRYGEFLLFFDNSDRGAFNLEVLLSFANFMVSVLFTNVWNVNVHYLLACILSNHSSNTHFNMFFVFGGTWTVLTIEGLLLTCLCCY